MSAPDPKSIIPFADPASPTLPRLWREMVAAYGNLDVIRKDGRGYRFREVDERSAALARGLLAQGAGKGERIGVLMPNNVEWVIAWIAINRIGAVAVTLSTFFSARELAYGVRHADVSILLCAANYLRHDYAARLEEGFPELAGADGTQPLALSEAPFLRSVWFSEGGGRGWSRGAVTDLEAAGRTSKVYDAKMLAAVEEAVHPSDQAIMIYTSGSTAFPKAVVHTQGVIVRKSMFMARGNGIIPANMARGDRSIVTMPFFWIGGFLSLSGAMAHGAAVICNDDHSPKAILQVLRSEKATHLTGSLAVLMSLRDSTYYEPGDLDRLKAQNTNQKGLFLEGTGYTRDQIPMSLGMTETFGPHSGDNEGGFLPPGVTNSLGRVLPGMEYKLVNPATGERVAFGEKGELCVRGEWLMDGMYKRERHEVFDEEGFYHTGDQCWLAADGFLYFDCRIGGMIKTSGANVSPEEVEEVIRAAPGVLDVAVLGIADRKVEQMVVAVVARQAGASLDEAELKARLRAELSSFKVPKRIFFMPFEDLPRTPSNKIRKPVLVEMILDQLAKEPAGEKVGA